MREIKFRAWCKDTKEMYYDVGVHRSISEHHLSYKVGEPGWLTVARTATSYELSQFTGLHDRNGKEIWEGDVVYNPDCNGKHEVKWMELYEGVGLGIDCSSPIKFNFCEVIGNIYEHPELLKE